MAELTTLLTKFSTMIERDDNIPGLDELVAELDVARRIATEQLPELARFQTEVGNV